MIIYKRNFKYNKCEEPSLEDVIIVCEKVWEIRLDMY